MEENKEIAVTLPLTTYAELIESKTRVKVLSTFLMNCDSYIDVAKVQQILGLQVTNAEKGEDE